MSNLQNLPNSEDEYWDGEVNRISDVLGKKCTLHQLTFKKSTREMTCRECGCGFPILPHVLRIEDGKVFVRENKQIGENLTIED